jgi:hypothetical protein
MGVAFCVVFSKDVPPHGTVGADYMALAKAYEKLDALAEKNGLRTVGSFLSQDPEELAEMMDMDVEEMGAPPEEWFVAADALAAVQALIAHLRSNPKAVPKPKETLAELQQVQTELTAAVKAKVKVHFSLVM